jgi:hypothetical protein
MVKSRVKICPMIKVRIAWRRSPGTTRGLAPGIPPKSGTWNINILININLIRLC